MKTSIFDFNYQFAGHGHYKITYTSPITGKKWSKTVSDMTLIDEFKGSDSVSLKRLNDLKRMIKAS